MSDLLRAIDNIRSYLDAGASVPSDRLRENAKLYSEACQKVNDRLSECATLLGQGLRSEAIHQAQLDPPLLDQMATLDFPGADRWAQIASSCGVPTPLLQVRLAQQLNLAYAEDRPLVEFMKTHRRLALSKGELNDRIKVLRKIAEIDRANFYWEEDVRVLERARHTELKELFERAKKEQDFEQIHAIHHEALSLEWREVPEEAFVRAVENALKKVKDHELKEQFEQWEAAFNQCLQDRNFAQARAARAQIQSLMQANNVGMHDPILRGIPQMLNWLAQEEAKQERERQFEAAIRKLQGDLNVPEPDMDKVKASWKAVNGFGYPVPRRLEEDYLACEYRDAERKRRKKIVTVGGVVVVLILVGIGIFFWVDQARKRSKLNEAIGQFTLHVKDERWEIADSVFKENEERFGSKFTDEAEVKSGVLALKNYKDKQERQKADVQKRFTEAMEAAFTDPTFRDKLSLAESSVVADDQKLALKKRREDFDTYLKTQRSTSDMAFDAELKKLEEKHKLFEVDIKNPLKQSACETLLSELEAGVAKLAKEQPLVGDRSLADRLDTLKPKVTEDKQILRAAMQDRGFTTGMDRVFEGTFRPTELTDLLKKQSREDPTSLRSKDFDLVVAERDAWEAQLHWNEFLKSAGDVDLELGADMSQRIVEMENFMKLSKTFLSGRQEILPRKEILAYETYLKAYNNRNTAIAAYVTALKKREYQKELFIQRLKNGNAYYFFEDPTIEINKARGDLKDKVLLSPILTLDDLRKGRPPAPKPLTLSDFTVDKPVQAPQVTLAYTLAEKMKNFQRADFDKSCAEMLGMIANSKEVEPILAADLAVNLIDQIEKGNPLMLAELTAARDALKRIDRDFVWIDPTRNDPSRERERAREALKLLPEPAKLLTAVSKSRGDITKVLKQVERPVQGWLYRESANSFRCRTPNRAVDDGYLYVMAADGGAVPHWVRIATVTSGRFTVSVPPDARIEGRPLFLSKILLP